MDSFMDQYRTGPDTIGGRYMRRFWHPVYRSEDLKPGWAKPIKIMSDNFTLYRGESGTAHVVTFRCAHRGLQLSVGWVEGDCIRCRYHGWKYDSTGQCIEVPTEPESTAKTIRIRSYPTVEYLGFIFAYFGEGEPPPPPRFPDYENGKVTWTESYVRPCNFFYNLETDPVHIPFVHRESELFYNQPVEVPTEIRAEESDWGITLYTVFAPDRIRTYQFGWPNMRSFKARDRNHLVWRVPIDDESHTSFQLDVMNIIEGDEGEKYKQRHEARTGKRGRPYGEVAEAVLRGEIFSGAGKFLDQRHFDTNYIEDIRDFSTIAKKSNGSSGFQGEASILYVEMGCNTMSAHLMEFPVGTYAPAHRHEPGAHILILSGQGYSLHWIEGSETVRIDWRQGSLFAPSEQWYHQHFNSGNVPAKYIAFKPRGRKFRTKGIFMNNVSQKQGGSLIDYADENPQIRALYERECARNGVEVRMREVPAD